MNPVCRIDINRAECQKWMDDVYKKCREIFGREMAAAAWWQDDTPAIYKENIQAMTALDCHKLKRDLAREVAGIGPGSGSSDKPQMMGPRIFLWWHKLVLVLAYLLVFGGLVLLYRCVNARCKGNGYGQGQGHEQVHNKDATVSIEREGAPSASQHESQTVRKIKKKKSWLRRKCRHMFVHSEAELRRQKIKRDKEQAFHDEYVKRKIEKWTKARELEEQKRKDREEKKIDKTNERTRHTINIS